MDLSGGRQTCFPWAEYQPALVIPTENLTSNCQNLSNLTRYNPIPSTSEAPMSQIVTPSNLESIRATIPCDQAAELAIGCESWSIQGGHMTVWPNGRGAIAQGGDSRWGDWDAERRTLLLEGTNEQGQRIEVDELGVEILRYNIEFFENPGNRAADVIATTVGGTVISNTPRFDGAHDLAIIEFPAGNVVDLEQLLEQDPNVLRYR